MPAPRARSWAAALLLPAAAAAWLGGGLAAGSYVTTFPPANEIRVPRSGAAADMFSMAFGARRLFADMWFVRLMQYYGTPELPGDAPRDGAHVHGSGCMHGAGYGKGEYAEFFTRARHVLEIDPSFVSAGLYAAGSLAFNLDRGHEAEAILNYGLKYRPKEWKYLQVLAAVGYSNAKDPAAVAKSLEPVLNDPDCPVMLKQLAAFLNKRIGKFGVAATIYADILATSKDPFYVENARRELDRLRAARG